MPTVARGASTTTSQTVRPATATAGLSSDELDRAGGDVDGRVLTTHAKRTAVAEAFVPFGWQASGARAGALIS
jgi:hypothetical protein